MLAPRSNLAAALASAAARSRAAALAPAAAFARAAALSLTTVLFLTVAAPLAAQSAGDYAAYQALVFTPVGALTPVMTSTLTGELQQGVHFAVRYAYMRDVSQPTAGPVRLGSSGFESAQLGANNFAATAVLPAGIGSSISLTAGSFYPSCDGCKAHLMLGAGGDLRLTSLSTGSQPDSPRVLVGLNGELGFGAPSDAKLLAASIGIPLSLVQRGQGMRIAVFVTPQVGLGSAYYSDAVGGGSDSGMRFGVGGGIGVYNPASTVAVSLGAQYVDFPSSTGVYGVTVRLGK